MINYNKFNRYEGKILKNFENVHRSINIYNLW